jgi:hypothetical protein
MKSTKSLVKKKKLRLPPKVYRPRPTGGMNHRTYEIRNNYPGGGRGIGQTLEAQILDEKETVEVHTVLDHNKNFPLFRENGITGWHWFVGESTYQSNIATLEKLITGIKIVAIDGRIRDPLVWQRRGHGHWPR